MSLQAIVERIINDAELEIAHIQENAQESATDIAKAAEKYAEKKSENSTKLAQRQLEQLYKEKIGSAKLAARDNILATKQRIIDEIFDKAVAKLNSIDHSRYIEVAADLIAQKAEGGEEVVFSKADKVICELVIEKANLKLRNMGKKEVKVSLEGRDIGRGFILKQGGIEQNLVFERLIKGSREELEARIAGIVFQEQ